MLSQKTTIIVYPDSGDAFGMVFYVPVGRDAEEYIDEMLTNVLSEKFAYSFWEFD